MSRNITKFVSSSKIDLIEKEEKLLNYLPLKMTLLFGAFLNK